MELGHRLRRHRVERVGRHRGGRHHRHHLIEQARAVLGQDRPVARRARLQREHLVPALAEGQEQRQQDGADQKPPGDRHVDDQRAGHRAQHEAAGHHQDVHDDHVLEPRRVRHQQHHVGDRGGREARREPHAERELHHDQHGGHGHRHARGEAAGGDGAVALLGMQAILVAVGHVVEQVDGAGEPAEDREGAERGPHRRREQALREDQTAEDEQVLDPLLRPQRGEDGAQHGRPG